MNGETVKRRIGESANRRTRGISASLYRRVFSTLLFLVSTIVLFSAPSSATEERPIIEKIEVEGLSSIGKDELLYLLDLSIGQRLDPDGIRSGIKRAFLKGIFEDIQVHAESVSGEEGATKKTLRIVVRERDVIRKIRVTGNASLSDRSIRNLLVLKEGGIMRYDLLGGAEKHLEAALSERGFPRASVSLAVEGTSKPYTVDLAVGVDEGEPLRVKTVILHGLDEEERKLVAVDADDLYDQWALRKNIEKIVSHFKKLGYLHPAVSYSYADGRLEIDVKKGRRLEIFFDGNTVFSTRNLKGEMPFYDIGEMRDDLVEEAARRVVSLYHEKGYPFAQVAPVVSGPGEEGDGAVQLRFFIYEGERVTVGSVKFRGVTLPEKNLKEIMSLREGGGYNPDLLFSDAEVLREFYNALGYIHVDVGEPEVRIEGSSATIEVAVKEGSRTVIDAVEVSGAVDISVEELRKAIGIQQGAPYNEVDIADARYRVIDRYLERGFVDVTVGVRVEFGERGARVTFEILEGERTFFGKTIVTGNRRTKRTVIERELLHREAAPFDYTLLSKERQRLYRLGLFTDVGMEGLDRYGGRRDVHIHVSEGNAGAVEFGIGYADYERFRGFFDISYRNLFGMNRQVSLRLEHSSVEQRYILNYYEPWFWGRQMPFRAVVLREEKKEKNIDTGEIRYRLKRHTVSTGVEKKLTDDIKGELYYEFSIVDTFDVKPDVILSREDTGTLAISGIRPGVIYDTRDNPFDPRKGILAGVTMKVATGLLLSETDFAKLVFNGSLYHELSRTFVFAGSFRLGIAQGFGSTRELPLVERFFLGGRNTVRGYEQDTLGPKGADGTPTGGNAFMMTNLELRTSLGKGVGVVLFVDGGNVWVKMDDIDWSLKYTAGLGLRYSTPVGPLRVDYGHKLMRERGESSGELHFSIGHAF